MLNEYQSTQEKLKSDINSKRVLAEKAVESLTSSYVRELNESISHAYLNQHKLDVETRNLQGNLTKLTKQAQQWMIICNCLNDAVKDLGDISTWTKTIESDVKFVADVVEQSYSVNSADTQRTE